MLGATTRGLCSKVLTMQFNKSQKERYRHVHKFSIVQDHPPVLQLPDHPSHVTSSVAPLHMVTTPTVFQHKLANTGRLWVHLPSIFTCLLQPPLQKKLGSECLQVTSNEYTHSHKIHDTPTLVLGSLTF